MVPVVKFTPEQLEHIAENGQRVRRALLQMSESLAVASKRNQEMFARLKGKP